MTLNRVLHIVSAMERGGAETLLMNVYRNLDKSIVQFDFVSHRSETSDFDDEIISLGGKLFRIQSLGTVGPLNYIRQLKRIMKENHYIAVHVHTDYQCGFPALAAKMSGIKKRICHAHSSNWPKGDHLRWRLALKGLQNIIRYSATDFCACSMEAANFLFGPVKVNKEKIHIIKNGIEVIEFAKKAVESNQSIRHEFNIPMDAIILGHVGRFSESKNHHFIIKVIKKMVDQGHKVVAILVGDGPLRANIEEEAQKLGILSFIRFVGIRKDIPRLMGSFDVFLFPSLYEGFGIVAVEAQSAGTPCVVSEKIPRDTDMGLNLISYIGLNEPTEIWIREIIESMQKQRPSQETIIKNVSMLGFDVKDNISEWLKLYGIKDEQLMLDGGLVAMS